MNEKNNTDQNNITKIFDTNIENSEIKSKIEILVAKLNDMDFSDVAEEVCELLKNMVNFFSLHISEIPNFDALSDDEKKALLMRFKSLGQTIFGQKIKSVEELVQVFVFTVLTAIGDSAPLKTQLKAREVINQRNNLVLSEFIKKAAKANIYKVNDSKQNSSLLSDSILHSVKEAMKYAGIKIDFNDINSSTLNILEEAQLRFKKLNNSRNLIR